MDAAETLICELTDDTPGLRRALQYTMDQFDVLYVRDDVAAGYTQADYEEIAQEARFEAVEAPMYEGMYTTEHGDFQCQIKWYDHVAEINYVTGDTTGISLSFDSSGLHDTYTLIDTITHHLSPRRPSDADVA